MRSNSLIRSFACASALAFAAGLAAQAQTPAVPAGSASAAPAASVAGAKVATIEIQAAIFQTKDGQKALADLQAKFNPVKAKLDAKRAEIAKNEDTLRKGQNTMSQDAQQKLARDVDVATKALNRDTDDANADLEQENQKLMNQLGGKMMAVINKYATEKGLVMVLDVSAQTTPVLWASNTIDITRDVIAAYDSGAAGLEPMPGPTRNMPTSAPGPRRPASGITKPQ